MRPPTTFKQDFLKKWAMGLEICASSSSTKDMSFLERKHAIKLSSDVALASARNGRTCWSRALISKASKQDHENKFLVKKILMASSSSSSSSSSFGDSNDLKIGDFMCKAETRVNIVNTRRSKKILRRSCTMGRIRKCAPKRILAKTIAKRMVRKKTQVLKSLVPGGEFMDDFNLLEETLDYIFSLQAQIDVMRKLVNVTDHDQVSNCK